VGGINTLFRNLKIIICDSKSNNSTFRKRKVKKMKKMEFLSLKKEEFIGMVKKITNERFFLRTKESTDNYISVQCKIGIPIAVINFELEEEDGNLIVLRKLNWTPLIFWMVPVLAFFEAINFFITYLSKQQSSSSYLITFFVWVIIIVFLLYLGLNETDKILDQLYKIEV